MVFIFLAYFTLYNGLLFKWVSSSNQVAKVLELQLQHQSFRVPKTLEISKVTGVFLMLMRWLLTTPKDGGRLPVQCTMWLEGWNFFSPDTGHWPLNSTSSPYPLSGLPLLYLELLLGEHVAIHLKWYWERARKFLAPSLYHPLQPAVPEL